jgi:hypothetical protein
MIFSVEIREKRISEGDVLTRIGQVNIYSFRLDKSREFQSSSSDLSYQLYFILMFFSALLYLSKPPKFLQVNQSS